MKRLEWNVYILYCHFPRVRARPLYLERLELNAVFGGHPLDGDWMGGLLLLLPRLASLRVEGRRISRTREDGDMYFEHGEQRWARSKAAAWSQLATAEYTAEYCSAEVSINSVKNNLHLTIDLTFNFWNPQSDSWEEVSFLMWHFGNNAMQQRYNILSTMQIMQCPARDLLSANTRNANFSMIYCCKICKIVCRWKCNKYYKSFPLK